MNKNQEKIKKVLDVKVKKHGKFKGKHIKPVTKQHVSTGPPLKVEDFSSNWKIFLNNQQKSTQAPVLKQKKPQQNSENILKIETKLKNKKTKSDKNVEVKEKKLNTKKTHNRKRKRSSSHPEGSEIQDKSNDIWFDVDPKLLQKASCTNTNKSVTNKDNCPDTDVSEKGVDQKENNCLDASLTRNIALDCEMVGVGIEGKESILARVSIVNSCCECVYDKYVTSKEKVIDYRTHVSGIRPSDLKDACDYSVVQNEVSDILKDRVLIGHALQNDLKVLMLSHPKKNIRDTSKYKPFRKLLKTKRPALKRLAEEVLHKEIQVGEHNSVIDAQITMQLYKRYKKEWERALHVKEQPTSVETKEIYMGDENKARKTKVNKWKKIRDRKKKKRDE